VTQLVGELRRLGAIRTLLVFAASLAVTFVISAAVDRAASESRGDIELVQPLRPPVVQGRRPHLVPTTRARPAATATRDRGEEEAVRARQREARRERRDTARRLALGRKRLREEFARIQARRGRRPAIALPVTPTAAAPAPTEIVTPQPSPTPTGTATVSPKSTAIPVAPNRASGSGHA
jgi:hypothetical protein